MKSVTLRTSVLATTVVLLGAVGFVTFVRGQAEESSQGRASDQVAQRGADGTGEGACAAYFNYGRLTTARRLPIVEAPRG